MNNVLLGKTIKAMYKLSGKTLPQLAEETGLTLDTINNLFYARIQKPGFAGVTALVGAMGFSLQQLTAFLDAHPDLPEDSDVTELFTQFVSENTGAPAAAAKTHVKPGPLREEIVLLNEEHEKQLDRFRADDQRHSEQLREQYERRVEELRESGLRMEKHYAESTAALKEAQAQEIALLEQENTRQKKNARILSLFLGAETVLVLLLLILDVLNRAVGWIR